MTRPGPTAPAAPAAPAAPVAPDAPAALDARLRVTRPGFTLDVHLTADPGEVLAVLGPNGSGKSTLLYALAGLVPPDEGQVVLGTEVWDGDAALGHRDPTRRRVGLVFQDYRLFPHLSVLDNVAFPARVRGARRGAARATARPWLERVGLAALADRRPGQLSGGQAQRVALARALAAQPRLLLLDEPLAALDATTRLEVRAELRRHLTAFAGPSIVVSHDPLDALILADRIVILENGRITQQGPPAEVARHPATGYVATLMGLNLYRGAVSADHPHAIDLETGGILRGTGLVTPDGTGTPVPSLPGARALVALAPTAIAVHPEHPGPASPRNVWQGTITGMELLTDRIRVAVHGAPPALVDITPAALAALGLVTGQRVWLSAKATEVVAYPDPTPAAGPGPDPGPGHRSGSDLPGTPTSVSAGPADARG